MTGQNFDSERENTVMPQDDSGEHAVFEIDLTLEEARRRAEVVTALGSDWNPMEAMRAEEAAYDALYSDLDAQQQETYDMLVAAGVLPLRKPGHVAD
ncbi:hypothetical protein Psi02_29260 [Planotetraspora silvatica]|uniref:Uncharacterized protein n=1 Tax=Planotetraspora silvatica TaxID=234614 RepID=A0A8J3UK86_9ACTN|nr:DUF6400 family protein [Planotetraspora silvatica]GII46502.1 hypothetical protein Psi02_29260 [Planotetraspora silvatica]